MVYFLQRALLKWGKTFRHGKPDASGLAASSGNIAEHIVSAFLCSQWLSSRGSDRLFSLLVELINFFGELWIECRIQLQFNFRSAQGLESVAVTDLIPGICSPRLSERIKKRRR
ncbi:hypothetical protein J6590_069386 [Homalodisca vitripennis]|nr:hypothetical protein J6590_069386 [Homalodisca vitripennis]